MTALISSPGVGERRLLLPTSALAPAEPPAVADDDWVLHRLSGQAMGTDWKISAYAPRALRYDSLRRSIDASLSDCIQRFSNWTPDSEIGRFNAAGAGPWSFSPDTLALIACSLDLARETEGAVDPALGALIETWGFGPGGPRDLLACGLPSRNEIDAALQRSGWRRLSLQEETGTICKPEGLVLDVCGIAKGWAVDRVSDQLRQLGATAHLVDIGGELKARGLKPDLQPWWVALEDIPDLSATAPPLRLALVEGAVATSGDYRRQFSWQGRRYAHTLDGRTGQPTTHGVASVSVLHPQAMMADAYATAIMVLGVERGMDLAERLCLPVRMLRREGEWQHEQLSSAMAAMRH
jgi:thiamine biosynthesis lipoprotein